MTANSSGGGNKKLTRGGLIAIIIAVVVALAGGGNFFDTLNQVNEAITPATVTVIAAEMTHTVADGPAATATVATATRAAAAPQATPRVSRSGLPLIPYAELPPEAQDTLALIESDGPFPFDRDGLTFQNREGILPGKRAGYYQEYTVITPGSSDRGARRIVTGAEGEIYYTDDHYDSFREVSF
ncbi:MAG: ribonuclease [Caldilineaceae bacterium]|nr:ribonuclease [Caldilineaceae bacterium]